jgi:hypothetical protein
MHGKTVRQICIRVHGAVEGGLARLQAQATSCALTPGLPGMLGPVLQLALNLAVAWR